MDHNLGIHIWPGAGPVVGRTRQNGSVSVLARSDKGDQSGSVMRIWDENFVDSGPDPFQMIFAVWDLND